MGQPRQSNTTTLLAFQKLRLKVLCVREGGYGDKGDEGDEPGAEWFLTNTHHLRYLLSSPYLLFLHDIPLYKVLKMQRCSVREEWGKKENRGHRPIPFKLGYRVASLELVARFSILWRC